MPTILGPYRVVLGVVGGINRGVHARGGFGEGDVSFEAAGPDATKAASHAAAEPRIARTIGRADVELVVCSDHSHCHVAAKRAVEAGGCELELLRLSDPAQVLGGPSRHSGSPFD